mgnify:FL=1
MNNSSEITANAKFFVKKWQGKGKERQDDKTFWEDLLEDVFGVEKARDIIEVQKTVKFQGSTKAIDIYIKPSKVVIEQKSRGVSLDKKEEQSDKTMLSPFDQAQRYYNWLDQPEQGRYIVTCNFEEFRIFDNFNKRKEQVVIKLDELPKRWKQLAFLTETYLQKEEQEKHERLVASKASEFVRLLYKELRKDNKGKDKSVLHTLNVFCVRVVFCLFAEDAGLFPKDIFRHFIEAYSAIQLQEKFGQLFLALNTEVAKRSEVYDKLIASFPYVNGGLFAKDTLYSNPVISDDVRELLLHNSEQLGNPDTGEPFSWGNISPTNFGCIFESTIDKEVRDSGGMHYTTPENIHRAIDPLFLDQLKKRLNEIIESDDYDDSYKRDQDLEAFRLHLANLRFLDPACGSGNFLTEIYKALYRLDMKAFKHMSFKERERSFSNESPSKISIYQFYGIEINDFAASVAKTAMWISQCQMLIETGKMLGIELVGFPLLKYEQIHCADALLCDWNKVLKRNRKNLIYIVGNPPFLGSKNKSFGKEQKESKAQAMPKAIDGVKLWPNSGDLDFVCAWYAKAADYMRGFNNVETAFVSTNSITQGEQVATLWEPLVNYYKLKIRFAWKSFRWFNKADNMAHVHCVIIGLTKNTKAQQTCSLYEVDKAPIMTNSINSYLLPAEQIFIKSASKPIGDVPQIGIGNKPIDNQNYIFTEEQMDEFVNKEPSSKPLFHPYYGAKEFINNKPRYCLWLGDCTPAELTSLPLCQQRIKAVREFREKSTSPQTRELANKPTRFHVENMPSSEYILIPCHSSENRTYIPMGFMSPKCISSNAVLIVPTADKAVFGVLESRIHMAWMKVVCGRIKSDFRYSGDVVYNNFPWHTLTEEQKISISESAESILQARASFPDSTLEQLYKPELMPSVLVDAHRKNDRIVAKAYGIDLNLTDEEIALILMRRSVEMSKPKPKRKKRKNKRCK